MTSSPHPPRRERHPPLWIGRRLPGTAAGTALLVDALFFVSGLGQTAIVPLMPRMSVAYGLSASASALVLALPALAMLIVSAPAGLLADRWGARRVTIMSAWLLVLGCLLGCGGTLGALLAGRAVYGLSFGILWTAGAAWLAELGGARQVGPAIVCSAAGTMVGPSLGGLLAGGPSGTVPFMLIAAAGLLVAAALARTPAGRHARPPRPAARRRGAAVQLRDPRVLAGAGSLVVSGALGGVTQLLIASGLHAGGVSPGAIGLAFSACTIAYIAVSAAFVAVGGRGHTLAINALVSGLGAVALVPALFSSAPGVLITALLLTAAPRGAISVVAYSVAGSGGEGGGAVFALLSAAWSAANVLTPLGAGVLAEHAGAHLPYLSAIVPSVLITALLLAGVARGRALPRGRRRGRRRSGGGAGALQPTELLERDMAADPVTRLLLDELRLGRLAVSPSLRGQRVWKGHPEGGCAALGISPARRMRKRSSSSRLGTAESSASV